MVWRGSRDGAVGSIQDVNVKLTEIAPQIFGIVGVTQKSDPAVETVEEARDFCQSIGYPVICKAAFGGGTSRRFRLRAGRAVSWKRPVADLLRRAGHADRALGGRAGDQLPLGVARGDDGLRQRA